MTQQVKMLQHLLGTSLTTAKLRMAGTVNQMNLDITFESMHSELLLIVMKYSVALYSY